MIQLSIIILTFNCDDVIIDNFNNLLSQDFSNNNYEIIIIDDNSNDKTPFLIDDFIINKENMRFYKLRKNHGNGYCKNLGIKLAKAKILFFLDDHLKIENKKTLLRMYNFLDNNPKIAGVCLNYISSSERDFNLMRDIRRFTIYDKNNKNLILSPNKFIPFSIVISALNLKIINHKKIFPEDFKKNSAEDTLFQITSHERGLVFAYLSNMTAIHNHGATLIDLIIKSKRELNGFAYIIEKKIENKYFRSIYLPCFFSFPLFLWCFIFINFFIPWTILFTFIFLLLETAIILKVFNFSIKFSIKLKTFIYCFCMEMLKIFYIFKIIIKKPEKSFALFTLLIKWEFKKIIYIYENRS